MTDLSEITGLPRGARFYRADLHIHSIAGSHDVTDSTATPEAIVALAAQEGLRIIAITDHNEISGVAAALTAGSASQMLVIPGVELSTPEGHLLCYLPDLDSLQRFYSQLGVVDRGTQNSRCQNGMLDCLNRLQTLGGFGVLAHVDAGKGLEVEIPGAPPHKVDILCHQALLGIELKNATSTISYAEHDSDAVRVGIGRKRIEQLGLGSQQFLARVLNSDSHTLQALGRNASGDKRVTRYKMHTLSFDSLKIALEDSDARVRIEDDIPPSVPYVRGIHMSGDFLDGQSIHFGPNLNCIIGGRGTGKSTTFEAIRCLTGQPGGTNVVDSDVWPTQIDLFVEDQAGQIHSLMRARGGDVENVDDPLEGPINFPVECYGQGETQQISMRAQTDPAALLDYLDRFIDIRQESATEKELRQQLLDLQTKIEEATRKVEIIPQLERDLKLTQSQIQTIEKEKAKDIINLQRKVEREREARATISRSAQAIGGGVSQQDIRDNITALKSAVDPNVLVVGNAEFSAISAEVATFESSLSTAETNLKASSDKLATVINIQLAAWRTKEQTTLKTIEDAKKQLESQGIRVDMAYIQKLATDEARLKKEITSLMAWKTHLTGLWTQRNKALKERWVVRDRIATMRVAFAKKASSALRSSLSDLNVTLKFEANSYSPDANAIIVETMGWRTVQVPRAAALTETLTVPKLLEAISQNDLSALQALATSDGGTVFTKAESTTILERLSADAVRFRLERCEVFDRPRLTVTKVTVDAAGNKHPRTREFRQLSLGQQQSVLLALMLSAETNTPLIIDQPEDNLDGEFIYKSVVPVLRRAKERRQVIIVTHNANIAVLGDAEQIVVLRGSNERALISSRGSIDDPATQEAACAILEGSKEAFQRRARTYGI